MRLTIECEQEEDGRWLAELIELPGVLAYGRTPEEAVARTQALGLRVLADRIEHGEGVTPLMDIRSWPAARIDPVMLAIASAPYDDEPVSSEEAEAVRLGREQAARGECCSDADLWRELGHASRDPLD